MSFNTRRLHRLYVNRDEDSKIETHEIRAFWKEGTDANPNIKRSLKKVAEAIWASTESSVEETAVEDAVQLIPEIE